MPSARKVAAEIAKSEEKKQEKTTRTTRSAKKGETQESKPITKTKNTKQQDLSEPKKKKSPQDPELKPVQKPIEPKSDAKKGKAGKKDTVEDKNGQSPQSKQADDKTQPQSQPTSKQPQKEKQLKRIVLKGAVPVDQYFSKPDQYKIYSQEDKNYAATLNQANLSANNNKFYIIQLLQHESFTNEFILFTRWGRVGVQGQSSEAPYKNKDAAIKDYSKKLNDKKKTYTEVEMNYQDSQQQQERQPQPKKEGPASTLPTQVQDLIKLIFDMKMMAKQMKEIGYDANRMPLGKLAKSSILKGYTILQKIMSEIKDKNRKDEISKLSSEFYSQIPHNFGFTKMANFVLDSEKKVKDKLEMLQSIEDIQIFTKLLEGNENEDVNQLDSNYQKLNTTITPLDKSSPAYQLLLQYVKNTHAHTHTAYKLQVQDIFEVAKTDQVARYKKEIGNKQLLWHGSRLTNFVGILSQGLRIAPPQAPVTGYMFGKGVYFADMVTKSANYCFASKQNNTGLMLLCQVALGNINQKFYADYYANLLPQGKHSTKGCGKTAPKQGKMLEDVLVPCGQGISTGIQQSSLLYNEFIVYDVAQIKCRYLFKMKFIYN